MADIPEGTRGETDPVYVGAYIGVCSWCHARVIRTVDGDTCLECGGKRMSWVVKTDGGRFNG